MDLSDLSKELNSCLYDSSYLTCGIFPSDYIPDICANCFTHLCIDPEHIYSYDMISSISTYEWDRIRRTLHSKYSYSYEIEPKYWITFCRRSCEMRYTRICEMDGAESIEENEGTNSKKCKF